MLLRKLLISLLLLTLSVPASMAQTQAPTNQIPTSQLPTGQPPVNQAPTAPDPSATQDKTSPPQDPAPQDKTGTPDKGTADSTGSKAPLGDPPVQEPDESKVKHDGGRNDVDAIGNRKIGGRGMGDWYSLETEIRMGKEYSQQVEASVKLVQDPVVTEYVNRIGQNLVRNSDAKVPFTIKVIDSDDVNAFALPGGFFYV